MTSLSRLLIGSAVALLAVTSRPAGAAELAVPDSIAFERGVEFSNAADQHLQMNIARPKHAAGALPVILCIHGGGFRAGTRESYDKLCVTLASHGYVAATMTYRLAPAFPFPVAVIDCKAAVRWLRANATKLAIDPKRIGVTGGSAGGHLVQFLGVTGDVKDFDVGEHLDQSAAVSCVVNYYGPSDLTKSYGKSVDAAEVLPLFFGGALDTKLKEHVRGSPLYWVTPNAAPTLIVHGTEDKYVNYEQAGWMVDKLKAAQVEVELLTLPGAGHGFKGEDASKAEAAMIEFFNRHLKTK